MNECGHISPEAIEEDRAESLIRSALEDKTLCTPYDEAVLEVLSAANLGFETWLFEGAMLVTVGRGDVTEPWMQFLIVQDDRMRFVIHRGEYANGVEK